MLKNRTIAEKLGSVMFAGLMVLTAGVAVGAAPASAATSCNAWLAEKEVAGLNQFRAAAVCTDIDSNVRVRVVLDRESASDYYSPWITIENKAYYTDWATCPAGCDASLQVRQL
ncbi:hypothetical protein GCM10017772_35180 [Promicromonospora soli]|uniref:Alpha amylase inhibitor n=1 Tax=Promicromonospora soli TaxID=2035533 RepID=A0A919G234_9MICO|nr:hypothetical protein GCM10017772_35180 [Promicromonospora soli]